MNALVTFFSSDHFSFFTHVTFSQVNLLPFELSVLCVIYYCLLMHLHTADSVSLSNINDDMNFFLP